MNTIDVVLVTWPNHPKRMEYLERTWDSLRNHLSASRHEIKYFCSSESERDPACQWCGPALEEWCARNQVQLHWADGEASLGHGMNAAMRIGDSECVLIHQDDFALQYPLDLSPGAEMLHRNRSVSLIRYGYPPQSFGWILQDYQDGWKRFDWEGKWSYGDEPHLQRRSFPTKYGWYNEANGHASEGEMLWKLCAYQAVILAADKRYYEHIGTVSAVPAAKEVMSGRTSKR